MCVKDLSPSSYSWRKTLQLIFGLGVAAVFIYLSIRNISWSELSAPLSISKPLWILLGLLCFIVGHFIRIYRWSCMLNISGCRVSLFKCFGPYVSCFALNNVLPFRAGDVVRLFAFNSHLGTSTGVIAGTLFIERLLDLLMVLSALLIALFVLKISVNVLFDIGLLTIASAILAILCLILFPAFAIKPVVWTIEKMKRLGVPKVSRLSTEISRLNETLSHLGGISNAFRLILLSASAWLFEALMFLCAAYALPSITHPLAALLAMSAGTLSTAIPAAPGYVGTFHYFVKESMVLCGNPDDASLAYAILSHALLWMPLTIAGGLYLAFKKRGFKYVAK